MLKKGNWQEPVTDECHDRPGKPGKRSGKKLGQNSSRSQFSDARQLEVAYFKTWHRRSLFSGRAQTCRNQSNVWNSRRLLRVTLKFETKIFRSDIFAQVNLISAAPTLQNLRIGLRRRQSGKSDGPAKQRGSWPKSVFKLQEKHRATFFSLSENRCLPASNLKPEEREFVVDSGASMHMISNKDLSDAEMETLTKSCSPTTVITSNGEVQTHEEAIVYVKELDKFLKIKVLEDKAAVSSLGKLCDGNGYSYEWINGQKPHLTKNAIRIQCNTENFVPIVVPSLWVSSSSSLSTSTSMTPSRQEIDHPTSSSSSSTSPTMTVSSDSETRAREDLCGMDSYPVTVSSKHVERQERRDLLTNQANPKSKTQEKRRSRPRAANFGDLIRADHKVLSEGCESRNNHRYAVVVQDLATQWNQAYPCKTKTSPETQRSLQKFLEPDRKPKVIHTDNSLEFGKSCENLSWNHCTSTPHRSETNGFTERAVRRIEEGDICSAVAVRSGQWMFGGFQRMLRNAGISPYLCKELIETASIRSWCLAGYFLGYALHAGEESGRQTCRTQTLKNWRWWTHRNSMLKDTMQRRC